MAIVAMTRLFRSLICRRNYLFAVKDVPAQEVLREKTGVESLADPRRFRRKEALLSPLAREKTLL